MKSIRYVHWQDGDMWLGYLEEYPDYMTQGETLQELEENLRDIYADLTSGAIPCVRKVAELQVPRSASSANERESTRRSEKLALPAAKEFRVCVKAGARLAADFRGARGRELRGCRPTSESADLPG